MILLWAWMASVVSLFCSLVVWVLRLLVRDVRAWLRRRHARHQPAALLMVQPPPVSASAAREVWELERCVYWLLWALSRDVHPQALTASARVTDPSWWATVARVRATIGHLSATAPDVELAAWCLHVVDIDRRSGARP